MRLLSISILIGLCSILPWNTSSAEGKIMITSYTNDFEFAAGSIGCPKGSWGNAFVSDLNRLGDKMDIRDYERLFQLIDQFEHRHGIQIRSKTRVRDFKVIEDRIRTEATGPVDEIGTQICDLISGYL